MSEKCDSLSIESEPSIIFNYLCLTHRVSTMATGSPQDLRAGLEEGCYKLVQKSNAKSAVWDKFVNSAVLAPVGYRCPEKATRRKFLKRTSALVPATVKENLSLCALRIYTFTASSVATVLRS